jgi:hypothetical protein
MTPQTPNVSDQSQMTHGIQVGDTVAYSQSFLHRQNLTPDSMPIAQGKVKLLHRLGKGIVLVDIEWDKPGLPKRVNVKNLFCVAKSG